MAVHWEWKCKMGKITIKQDEKRYNINVYTGGNCDAVFIYDFKDKDTGKNMYAFHGFIADKKHADNIVKNYGNLLCWDSVVSIELNVWYPQAKRFMDMLVKNGYKVRVYYKDRDKKKSKKA